MQPVTVNLQVRTSGGIDGKSTCQYSIRADNYLPLSGDTFIPPGTIDHKAALQLFGGEHKVYVRCIDPAGNTAEASTSFDVELDTNAPIATRAYKDADKIKVVTNEDSECVYQKSISMKSDGCDFAFADGNKTEDSGMTHSIPFNQNFIYYIKCKDSYGNENSGCAINVKGVDLTTNSRS